MKKVIQFSASVFIATLLFVGLAAGQGNPDENRSSDGQRPGVDPQDGQANMLRQLGLSRDQIMEVRRLNTSRKPHMENAQARLRQANRALDAAIYADEVNETDFQARLKDVQLAQAEVLKVRFINELAIRRILTPEQLVRFRNMRQRFERAKENIQNRADGTKSIPTAGRNAFQEQKPAAKPAVKPDRR